MLRRECNLFTAPGNKEGFRQVTRRLDSVEAKLGEHSSVLDGRQRRPTVATHRFQPTRYYNTIGWHEPALRVANGDTVITTTVDALGYDAAGQRVTSGPNPQTGPFSVEGAEPGDTLAVRLEHLFPNRDMGVSGTVVAPNTVDPSYAQELPKTAGINFYLKTK